VFRLVPAFVISTLAVLLSAAVALAGELRISDIASYTEHRSWNEAGSVPGYFIVVMVTVVPSGLPTVVVAEQGSVRQALFHFPALGTPHLYALSRRADPALMGSWRIVAERGDAKAAHVLTPVLARPREVPIARNVRATGPGAEPQVSWELPSLAGVDVERIRVRVRGGKRLHDRFLDMLYLSDALPPTATTFTIPAGVLTSGERYIFEVLLENLEGGALANRSVSSGAPYTVSP